MPSASPVPGARGIDCGMALLEKALLQAHGAPGAGQIGLVPASPDAVSASDAGLVVGQQAAVWLH